MTHGIALKFVGSLIELYRLRVLHKELEHTAHAYRVHLRVSNAQEKGVRRLARLHFAERCECIDEFGEQPNAVA